MHPQETSQCPCMFMIIMGITFMMIAAVPITVTIAKLKLFIF